MVEVIGARVVRGVSQTAEFVLCSKKKLVLVKAGRGTAVEPEGCCKDLCLSLIWLLSQLLHHLMSDLPVNLGCK